MNPWCTHQGCMCHCVFSMHVWCIHDACIQDYVPMMHASTMLGYMVYVCMMHVHMMHVCKMCVWLMSICMMQVYITHVWLMHVCMMHVCVLHVRMFAWCKYTRCMYYAYFFSDPWHWCIYLCGGYPERDRGWGGGLLGQSYKARLVLLCFASFCCCFIFPLHISSLYFSLLHL